MEATTSGSLFPEAFRVAAEFRAIRRDGREAEFFGQLALPLGDQRRRGQHQGLAHHAARPILFQHEASFDGLAQAHFVSQQGAAFEVAQDLADGLMLVDVAVDAGQRGKADQILEALREAEFLQAAAEEVIRQRAGGCGLRQRGRRKEGHAHARRLGLGWRFGGGGGRRWRRRRLRFRGRRGGWGWLGGYGGLLAESARSADANPSIGAAGFRR